MAPKAGRGKGRGGRGDKKKKEEKGTDTISEFFALFIRTLSCC
jgi:hypothetical protein